MVSFNISISPWIGQPGPLLQGMLVHPETVEGGT